ncbi:hypothetical protein [Caviibacter abscessus]|nr:hypothetical protein [Caviibacter abscessus]
METLLRNFILEIAIPLMLYLYSLSYKKQINAITIPKKADLERIIQ